MKKTKEYSEENASRAEHSSQETGQLQKSKSKGIMMLRFFERIRKKIVASRFI